MRRRTRSREFALQILYQIELGGGDVNEVLANFWREKDDQPLSNDEKTALDKDKKDEAVREYATRLVEGVTGKLADIDAMIERYSENWEIGRMAVVDKNILRLAAYELLFLKEIPLKVAINEAVELAKRYSEADSSKFVNGILDRIAKDGCKRS